MGVVGPDLPVSVLCGGGPGRLPFYFSEHCGCGECRLPVSVMFVGGPGRLPFYFSEHCSLLTQRLFIQVTALKRDSPAVYIKPTSLTDDFQCWVISPQGASADK